VTSPQLRDLHRVSIHFGRGVEPKLPHRLHWTELDRAMLLSPQWSLLAKRPVLGVVYRAMIKSIARDLCLIMGRPAQKHLRYSDWM